MKKALLASTAIVTAAALASPAAAADRIKLGLGGYMEQYIGFIDQEDGDVGAGTIGKLRDFKIFDNQSDSEIYFSGSTTLDNGIKLALRVELEADAAAAQIDESWLDIQTAWGTLRLGADDPVSDLMSIEPKRGILNDYNNWVPAIGGNTIAANVANQAANVTVDDPYGVRSASDDNGVYYISPKLAGFQVAASYQPEMGTGGANGTPNSVTDSGAAMSATLNWAGNAGDVAISTGYAYLHETGTTGAGGYISHNVGLNLGYAGFGVGAAYGRWLEKNNAGVTAANNAQTGSTSVDGHMYVVGLWYITGPIEVGFNYKHQEVQGQTVNAAGIGGNGNDENDLVGVYFNYQISDGVKWESMIFRVDYDDELSLDAASHDGGWGVVGGLRLDF